MRYGSGLALVGFFLASGLTSAQPCGAKPPCCGELPPVKCPPITIVFQPPPPPPVFTPPAECPNIRLFQIDQKRPNYAAAPPPAPVRVFTLPPPVAAVCKIEPPCVDWFRILPGGTVTCDAAPCPPLRIARLEQKPTAWQPPVCVPNVKVVSQPPPGGPLSAEACQSGCGACGNSAPIIRGR
jgi:hypothetical protein